MWPAIRLLTLGIFCTAQFLAAISVYVFHDVDKDKIGHWNEAFADLSVELAVFTLIVSGAVWLLALLGRQLFNLRGYSPRASIGLSLGIATAFFQYPFEFAARKLVPNLAESLLTFYLLAPPRYLQATATRDLNQRRISVRAGMEATGSVSLALTC
jgi:hypothetical protein